MKKKGGENSNNKPQQGQDGDDHFGFANSVWSMAAAISSSKHALRDSVIFDSGCSEPLTYDRTRFIGEIIPANSWIKTPNGDMKIEGYDTMQVVEQLNGKDVKMTFKRTAYVPATDVTLVSVSKLIKEGYDRDMHSKTLVHKSSGRQICQIIEKYGVFLLEFNPVAEEELIANSMQPSDKTMTKATPWIWHLRMGHCRPAVIDRLRKIEGIEVTKNENAPKTINCQMCAVSKMHKLVQRSSTAKATKPFQVIHFDLTIEKKAFDDTSCIAHFTDEFTSFN
jgi:hypothetical protein